MAIILAGCSGSGLEGIDTTNPSYAAPSASIPGANVVAADRPDIIPLTDEQEKQIGSDAAFVPAGRPANAAVAATGAVAAPTAQGTAAGAAAPAALTTAATQTNAESAAAADAANISDGGAKPATNAAAAAQATAAAPATATAAAAAPPANGDNASQRVATAFAGPVEPTPAVKKQGFLSGLFAQKPQAAPVMSKAPAAPPKPVLQLASVEPKAAAVSAMPRSSEDIGKVGTESLGSDLPGVRKSSLFEITRKNGIDDDSDVDLHEDEETPVQFASAAGMGRLAPNGLLKQRDSVDVSCLKPSLVRMLKKIEGHYSKRLVVTSGYRSPSYNRKVRGARKSMHMFCAAVDVQLDGVSKWELARFARSMPGRGGVGTYCHTNSIHIDVGPERDWNWRCRSRRK